jgi:hypothetical protein
MVARISVRQRQQALHKHRPSTTLRVPGKQLDRLRTAQRLSYPAYQAAYSLYKPFSRWHTQTSSKQSSESKNRSKKENQKSENENDQMTENEENPNLLKSSVVD